jgi:hypothetical protein
VSRHPFPFDSEGGEAHLFDQEFEETMFHREELVCSMRGLSQANNGGVTYDLLEGE